MKGFYSVVSQMRRGIFLFALLIALSTFGLSTLCIAAGPSYEMQVTPGNGAVTIEQRPLIRWLVFPNENRIRAVSLLLDGQFVSVEQVMKENTVSLEYHPLVDLLPGEHRIEYKLDIVGYQPIIVSSSFVIVNDRLDLYSGKNGLKVTALEEQAIVALNQYRKTLGLSLLTENQKLSMVAQAHANYQVMNRVRGHYEQQSSRGFTGIAPQNRADYMGYPGAVGEGISFVLPVDSLGIDRLIDAPYHRLGLINPNFREVGIGFGWDPDVTNVNCGTTQECNDDRVMLYPYSGQVDAKIAWFVAEDPNPLARYGLDSINVGYPISLSIHDSQTVEFKTISAKLVDENKQDVPFYLVDSAGEKDHKCDVFLIPKTPLLPGKTYTVTVNGIRVEKDGVTAPMNRTWSFATRAELSVRHMGIITLSNSECIEVIMNNGDIPDLNYTLTQQGEKVRSYVGQERQYYSYGGALLENGEYSLEISSSLFPASLTYRVRISGSGEERQVVIVKE